MENTLNLSSKYGEFFSCKSCLTRLLEFSAPLRRLRYQAALAERQFNQVDPDNRLVASELEKRWEHALEDLKKAETIYSQNQQESPLVLLSQTR